MSRWWFLENKQKMPLTESVSSVRSTPQPPQSPAKEEKRIWNFRVHVTQPLAPYEAVGLTGECSTLGDWLPQNGAFLEAEKNEDGMWSAIVKIPAERSVPYRYFIYSRDVTNVTQIHIRRWETHLNPRAIAIGAEPGTTDTFGQVNGIEKIDGGWLTTETIIQFKFVKNPFQLKQKLNNRSLCIKLTPMNLRIASDVNSIDGSNDDSGPANDNSLESGEPLSSWTLAEVATLKYPSCSFEAQTQFGRVYNVDDILVFRMTVAEPENVAYLIDLYTYHPRSGHDEPPQHLGYHYVLPNFLRKSAGRLDIPITCATRHRPLGMMNLDYLKITPLREHELTMKCSYARHWNKRWTGLDVGHRGAGVSFKGEEAKIRENTIASLKEAIAHGADMVEFDVQLSKDLVPVIYHDFEVYVSLKKKTSLTANDMLKLPMKDLTLEQLSNLKVYHTAEASGSTRFNDEHLDEHQPFPTLSDALDMLDMSVGFNVEIKWSQAHADGSKEMENSIDRNLYLDRILDVVLRKAGERRIVFSCFDADICTMIRCKQNVYPVMFLTLGVTDRYQPYHDPRCNTIESAVSHAHATELLGIVAHTEDLLRDSTQINLATDLGLIVFCWGDDNNSVETIKLLKKLGVHGIIYDKMDVLSTKEEKKSIFLMQQQSSDLLRVQALENKRNAAPPKMMEPEAHSSGVRVLELQNERNRVGVATTATDDMVIYPNRTDSIDD